MLRQALWMTCAASALVLGGAICGGGQAFAANANASASASEPGGGTTIGELVVTAEKREQTLQSAAVAISAYTSDKRDQIGIDSVQDMSNFTPGLSYNTGDDRVTLRGIGRYTNQLGADSSVGVYEDGAFETFTVKAGNDSIFVDRIEVLRGPQGTLYGRASIGGAINIISRRPTTSWYGEFRASVDNYGQHIEEGAVSGPINDQLQFRIAASKTDQAKGYFKNLSGGPSEGNVRDEWYLEGQIQGKWNDRFDFWLKAFGGEWNNLGGNAGGKIDSNEIVGPDGSTYLATPSFTTLVGNGAGGMTNDSLVPALAAYAAPGITNVVTTNPSGLDPQNFNPHTIYSNIPQQVKLHAYYGGVLKLNFHFDGFDIKYIGAAQHYAYTTREEYGENDQLATGVVSYVDTYGTTIFPNSELYYGEEHFFTTNEINIISTTKSRFQWVVGFYNFNETYKQPEEIALPGQTQLNTPYQALPFFGAGQLVAAPFSVNPDVYFAEGKMGGETFAGFAQVDWQAIETLKVTAGIRYSWDAKYGLDLARYEAYGPQIGVPFPAFFDITAVALPLNGIAQPGATAATIDPKTGLATRKLGASWSGVTATGGVQWEPDSDTNVYAKYSRGYKSGGFNGGAGLAANPETNPETSNDFQFGAKKTFGGKLSVDLAAFYDQYYNAQIPISVFNGSILLSLFYNVPEARSYGVELETSWQPTKALQLILSYGYNATEILNSGCIVDAQGDPTATRVGATPGACQGGAQDLHGAQLPNAPENKLALNANYTFFFEPGSLSLSASYIWRDTQYGAIFNRPYNLAPSWDQVDLRAEWKSADNHYSIIAFGKNVFNTVGYQNGRVGTYQASGVFLVEDTLTPPALYGIEFQYRF